MFMDYILESEAGYSYGVSQETMDEIDNIEIPTNLSEYAGLSPFECISKANYEFAKENADMFKAIAESEMKYIKENGTEPIWEAEDHQSVFQRFIQGVKNIIGKITAFFGKIIKGVETKVSEIYNKFAGRLDKKIADARGTAFLDKKISIKKYDPTIGANILNKDPLSVLNKVDGYKSIKAAFDSNKDEEGKTIEAKGAISQLYSAIFSGLSGADTDSSSSIKIALHNAMVGRTESVSYAQAAAEVQYFVKDPKANSLKAELKKRYNDIKKDLAKTIDEAKKASKKADRSTKKGSATGAYCNILNKYVQAMTITYRETSSCLTGKWFQACRLYLILSGQVSKTNHDVKKAEKKAEKEAKKSSNESFGFSFE